MFLIFGTAHMKIKYFFRIFAPSTTRDAGNRASPTEEGLPSPPRLPQ